MAKIYVETNADNEVVSWATSRGNDKEIEIEVEDNHPIFSQNHFYFKLAASGGLVVDEMLKQKIIDNRSNRKEIRELKNILAETDYYVIRKMDENTPIPADVQVKRQQARARLKQLGL